MELYVVGYIVAAFLTGTLALGGFGLFVLLRRRETPERPQGEALELRVASLEVKVEGLPSLWEEERRRVERSADAARKARDSAAKKLAEIEELDSEDQQLRLADEIRSEQEGMQSLRGNLGVGNDTDLMERAKAMSEWLAKVS